MTGDRRRRGRWRRAAALLVLGTAAACASGGLRVDDLPQVAFAPSLAVDLAASTRSPSGFYYRDLTVGSGAEVRRGRSVTVRYEGWLPNGSPVEQPGAEPATATFRVGAGEVIRGWDRGVEGMREGGRRQLILPPGMGYGPRAYGSVPPNSVLVFVVEAVTVK